MQGDTTSQLTGNAVARQLVLDELNMEICVRERLQETVESRIAWATCLQSSLGAVTEKGPGATVDVAGANPFQLAAADALNIAEAPLLLSYLAKLASPRVSLPMSLPRRPRRPPQTLMLGPTRATPSQAIAINYPLLNHCRIQHGREFGTHDDCIRGCAVQVPVDEEAWVIENGSELRHGGLPSLRRLFEIAVGSTGTSLEIASADGTSTTQLNHTPLPDPWPPRRFPALAPFLGRAAKRRGIVVQDENTPVDIDGGDHVDHRRRWHKPLIHRSRARPALDVEVPAESPIPQYARNVNPVAEGTRFHIVARVTISDRSLWIPIDQRSASSPDHTHKWVICIEAPTYSLPLGAILDRASVICLSPGTSPVDGAFEMPGPPFVASGTTAHPFLARLRLQWTSGSLNPPLEVDHWVELDALQAGSPVLGDEQVLDVELDRHTVFLPTFEHTQGSDPWNWDHGSPRIQPEPAPALPRYVVLLRSLVPKFPLTLRDTKSNVSAPLPYKRVSSAAQFRALIPGRRKAMEWARARALREAYEKLRKEKAPGEDYPHLSNGDVFSWLADSGLSLRQAVPRSPSAYATSGKRTLERITPSTLNTFCPVCGVECVERNSSWEGPNKGSCCHASPMLRLPLLDVDPVVCAQSQHHPIGPVHFAPAEDGSFCWSVREILTATDPTVMFAVRCIISQLRLSCFPKSENASITSAGDLDPNGSANTPMVDEYDIIIRSNITSTPGPYWSHWPRVLCLRLRDRAREKGGPRAVLSPAHVSHGVAGSFLTRGVLAGGVLAGLPPSPVALALATVVHPARDLSPPSVIMADTSCRDPDSAVHSLSHCSLDEAVEG
ncbi:hypothetical protein BJV77DRAFT_1071691 [Russula vinacea]|nr:hypothetical protein BJV77DRAFT_1071691 [Russula vinacea]